MPERKDQLRVDPVVSVVVPVYNGEKFIEAAIESVFVQSLSNWELIIVDDCSRDATWQITQKFASDERVSLLKNNKNLGQFPTHNRGAEMAQGRYIKFLHADDLLYPHCLEVMVSLMESYPMAGMGISGDAWPWCAPKLLQPKEVWSQFLLRQSSLMAKGPICSIFERDTFQAVGGYDERFDSSDVKMNLTIAMSYPVLVLPEGLTWYRIHGDQQVSAKMRANDTGQKEKIDWALELLADPNCPLNEKQKAEARRMVTRDFLLLCRHYLLHRKFCRAFGLWRASGLSPFELLGGWKKPKRELIESDLPNHRVETNWDAFPGQPSLLSCDIEEENEPLVSVIIVVDALQDALQASIDSVFAQRFSSWELLITGAKLHEKTRHFAFDEQTMAHVRVVESQESHGKWDVYNLAAAKARGRYLKFLDAGDLLYPNCLQMMAPMMMAHADAGLGISGGCGPYRAGIALDSTASLDSELFGTPRFLESPSAVIVQREQFLHVGGFEADHAPTERHLQLRLSCIGSVVLMPRGLVHVGPRPAHAFYGEGNWPLGWAQGYDWIIEWLNAIDHGLSDEQLRLAIGNLLRVALKRYKQTEYPDLERPRILRMAGEYRVSKKELIENPPFMRRGGSLEVAARVKQIMLQRPDWRCFGYQEEGPAVPDRQ